MLVVKMSLLILWDYFQSKQLPQKAENGHPPISLYLIETLHGMNWMFVRTADN